MKQKFFSVAIIMISLTLFFACSKKEAELEEVISFKAAESEETVALGTEKETSEGNTALAVPETVPVEDTTAPAEVRNLISSSGDSSVILSWTNPPDEDFSKVVITYGVDGVASVRGLPKGESKQYITGLNNGAEYTFTVMAVDRFGNTSEGVQVSSSPVAPEPVKIAETMTSPVVPEPVKIAETMTSPVAPEPVKIAETMTSPVTPEPVKVAETMTSPVAPEPVKVAETVTSPVVPEPVKIAETMVSPVVPEPVKIAETVTSPVVPEPVKLAETMTSPVASEPVKIAETVTSPVVPEPVKLAETMTSPVASEPVSVVGTSALLVGVSSEKKESVNNTFDFQWEPEPVIEPFQKESLAPSIQLIRSADGNIAYNFETVFDKTSEVSILAKASVVELNGEKSLMSAYRMGSYPVTQELFQAVMGINPSACVDSSSYYITVEGEVTKLKPCDKVSWYDAIAFCNKLSLLFEYEPCYTVAGVEDWSALIYEDIPVEYNADWSDVSCDFTRNGFRLPTEREWEFAARGGNPESEAWDYNFSGKASSVNEPVNTDLDAVAWYRYNICNGGVSSAEDPVFGLGYGTHETGLKEPNSLSLYDMSGNVWEWCWDGSDLSDINSTYEVDPVGGIPSDSCRVLRGGSWGIDASCCEVTSRLVEYESFRSARYGFRLVRTAGAE